MIAVLFIGQVFLVGLLLGFRLEQRRMRYIAMGPDALVRGCTFSGNVGLSAEGDGGRIENCVFHYDG